MEPVRVMKRWRKRMRALFRTQAVDRELDEELAFHLEMETKKNMAAGMTPEEAKREAKLAFGAVQKARGETRDARWLSWFPNLSLDFRLGGRMLVKYPGITIIGGLAMAFGIFAGAMTFDMISMLTNPKLTLPDADRIVKIRVYDVKESQPESRALYEFNLWRQSLRSVTDLGAYRDVARNLIVKAGDAQPVQLAEITSSAFRIAPTLPLLGRTLGEGDERAGAPLVLVVGYDTWKRRFSGDSGIIGRTVQVGDAFATVVGVMPEGYGFPISHDVWMPLRLDGLDQSPRSGPGINIFGKLAPGATLEQAKTELVALARRTAGEFPTTHQNLQPQIGLYAKPFSMPQSDLLMSLGIPAFAVMLLVLVCGNVALLMFARAATRESELIVRSALGASRARIVTQLFAEALVLGAIAAAVGLGAADFVLRRWGGPFLEENLGRLPFWYDVHISFGTVLYAVGLTLLAAVIAGVLPALKVTSGLGARLRQAVAGSGGLKFGGIWTAVIIIQVAFTTAFPAMVLMEQQMLSRIQTFDAGFPAEQYLAVMLEPGEMASSPADSTASAERRAEGARFETALETLRQRVAAEPGVVGVTFVDRLPTEGHREMNVELDDDKATLAEAAKRSPGGKEPLREVQTAFIDPPYFEVLQAPILAGRAFQVGDIGPNSRVVIVDQGFTDQVLEGRNAVGRRVRLAHWGDGPGSRTDDSRPWYEIIGVVKEMGMGSPYQRGRAAGVYMPVYPGQQGPTNMVVHLRGDPLSFVPQVRALATSVDPTLKLSKIQRADQVTDSAEWIVKLWLKMTVALTAVALMLSLAGIYAVMSFTVSRRTREIGIRVALGANARRVVVSIFRRPLTQVGIGVVFGALLAGVFLVFMVTCQDGVCDEVTAVTPARVVMLLLYSTIILGVCLLACVVPTKRALSVEPVDALRAE
jgi:putative ABC transport system permease protein